MKTSLFNPLASARPAQVLTRLGFLDGLRGLAAVYVVLHHCHREAVSSYYTRFPSAFAHATNWLLFGRVGVAVFIVLSGYCLALPVTATQRLRGGLAGFVARRSRRILPPYYAALALSLLVIGFTPLKNDFPVVGHWSTSDPAFTAGSIASHLLLMHNLRVRWIWSINGPLWSVATEWQIYFGFALILLPIWRRWNVFAAVGVAALIGVGLLHYGLRSRLDLANPHLFLLFALGMAAADASVVRLSKRWGLLAALFAALFWVLSELPTYTYGYAKWYMDAVAGLATACFVVWMTQTQTVLRDILSSRLLMGLGAFSYSLYLTHWMVLRLLTSPLSHLTTNGVAVFAAFLLTALPASIAFAYLFHLAFERPFMSKPAPKTEQEAEVAAIVSPAP